MGKTVIGLVLMLALTGCGEDPLWVGTYDAKGTWKLSGPLEGGRTVGDATSQLLCDELASALPAPSFVEDKVRDWLEGSVGGKVKSTVDANAPDELGPNGKLTQMLGQSLAAVRVDSTIVLDGDDDELSGSETITALEYVIQGKRHRVEATELTREASGITASWGGKGGDSELTFDRHPVALHYGELVRLAAADLLSVTELAAIESELSSALSCKTIVGAIIGSGSGLKISVAGWSHTVSKGELESACASAMKLAEKQAYGLFGFDTPVEVGGKVGWEVDSDTGVVRLDSADGFGGVVNVVPDAFAPKVGVRFTAESR